MNNEICSKCGREKREHEGPKYSCLGLLSGKFKPSGRVVVPVAFVEAVRKMINECGNDEAFDKVVSMLDQIDWKEKNNDNNAPLS